VVDHESRQLVAVDQHDLDILTIDAIHTRRWPTASNGHTFGLSVVTLILAIDP
jgi:hypothetical protein